MGLFEQGGLVLGAIFALSFSTWFLIVHKWLHVRRETRTGFAWIDSVITDLRQGRSVEARSACGERPSAAQRMVLMSLDVCEAGRSFSRKHRKEIVRREAMGLRRYLGLIAASGAALPLLGLLGTVMGMTKTFSSLTYHAVGEGNDLMARGVSEALITTQGGLVAALPILLMYGLLSSRIRRYMDGCTLAMKRLESEIGRTRDHV